MNPNRGWLYIVGQFGGTAVKIGKTRQQDLNKRLSGIQTGNPEAIELLAYFYCEGTLDQSETALHAAFLKDRVRGEWFEVSPELEEIYVWGLCGPRDPDEPDDPNVDWVWPCPGWNVGPVFCTCCQKPKALCPLCQSDWVEREGLCEAAIRAEEANLDLTGKLMLKPEDRWGGGPKTYVAQLLAREAREKAVARIRRARRKLLVP